MTSTSTPTPEEIIDLAASCGYAQRREMASSTLFFKECSPEHNMPPCVINIYPTTRSIMTHLNHSARGTNELWRSNAYDDLEELREFFNNPRKHSGKGYRNAEKAVRGCAGCGLMKARVEYSKNQWSKGPDANKCKDCTAAVGGAGSTSVIPDLSASLEGIQLGAAGSGSGADGTASDTAVTSTPLLTVDSLRAHDRASSSSAHVRNDMERRQFNCPDCPRYGRGTFVFFKKVPAMKPIVKCPQCKRASRGKCKRLYPIPRGSERGYGLYKCSKCRDTWGSSRAVGGIGQECYSCLGKGRGGVMVAPFRLEVLKKGSGNRGRGGPRGGGGMRRVPREPIAEDDVDEREYGDSDRARNFTGAGNALVGGGPGLDSSASYDYEPRDVQGDDDDTPSSRQAPVKPSRVPPGYKHRCAGCASGICRNRRVPKSEIHDVSDGNTVSTRASVVTNSSIDKTDFFDRDEDFSSFEEEEDRSWIKVED